MRELICLSSILLIAGCTIISSPVKTKLSNAILINSGTNFISNENKYANSILKDSRPLSYFLQRRMASSDGKSFRAFLLDSTRQNFMEVSISSHVNDSIIFNIVRTNLQKVDSFQFSIGFNFSKLKSRSFTQVSPYDYVFNFQSDSITSLFQINNSSNFILNGDILELLTGEIVTPEGVKVKFVALNDPHDVFESLTGLCLMLKPNPAKLNIECRKKAKEQICKSGKIEYKILTKDYLVAQDYFCQADCIK